MRLEAVGSGMVREGCAATRECPGTLRTVYTVSGVVGCSPELDFASLVLSTLVAQLSCNVRLVYHA